MVSKTTRRGSSPLPLVLLRVWRNGRRARFRHWCLTTWGFESLYRYCLYYPHNRALAMSDRLPCFKNKDNGRVVYTCRFCHVRWEAATTTKGVHGGWTGFLESTVLHYATLCQTVLLKNVMLAICTGANGTRRTREKVFPVAVP